MSAVDYKTYKINKSLQSAPSDGQVQIRFNYEKYFLEKFLDIF